jgi:alpha-L-fucosidase
MKVNGAAIYGTRISKVCRDENTFFTQSKDGKTQYALVCLPEDKAVPKTVEWKGNLPENGAKMKLLATGATVKWTITGDEVKVTLPASFTLKKCYSALTFSF